MMKNMLLICGALLLGLVSCKGETPDEPTPTPSYKNSFDMIGQIASGNGKLFPSQWDGTDKLDAIDCKTLAVAGQVTPDDITGAKATMTLKTDLNGGDTVRVCRAAKMKDQNTGILASLQNGVLKDYAFAFSDKLVIDGVWATKFVLYQPMSYICLSVSAQAGSSYDGAKVGNLSLQCPGAILSGEFTIDFDKHSVVASGQGYDRIDIESDKVLGTDPVQIWLTVLPCDLSSKKCVMNVNGARMEFEGRNLQPSYAYKINVGPLGGAVVPGDKSKQEFVKTPIQYKTEASAKTWTTAQSTGTVSVDGMNWMDKLTGYSLDRWGGYDGVKPESITSSNPEGFWRTGKYKGHHVMVDPDGNVAIVHGVNGVTPDPSKEASSVISKSEYNKRFSSTTEWVKYANQCLSDAGFNFYSTNPKRIRNYRDIFSVSDENTMRSYSDGKEMGQVEIVYLLRTFSWDYNSLTGKSYNKDYASVFTLMFDDKWYDYIDALAKDATDVFKDSRNFIGYYTDNELQFRFANTTSPAIFLKDWLKLSSDGGKALAYDKARKYAEDFMRNNYHVEPLVSNITSAMEDAFLKDVSEKYYKDVSSALRKYDQNHLILGSRLHGKPKSLKIVTQACAKYCDIISVNVYGVWEPNDSYFVNELPVWAPDKPAWVTEFYTRNANETYEGTPYGNTGEGGGWIVQSHLDRGVYYQNFTRKLLTYNYLAGWQWFQMTDDFLEAYGWNNKGIISPKYEYYSDCVKLMKQLNWNIYQIFNYYYNPGAAAPSSSKILQISWE